MLVPVSGWAWGRWKHGVSFASVMVRHNIKDGFVVIPAIETDETANSGLWGLMGPSCIDCISRWEDELRFRTERVRAMQVARWMVAIRKV